MKEKKEFTKRELHLSYWIVISVLIAIVILTGRLADNSSTVDYFGFAGTVVSIILAVVAIVYSFFQSLTFENTSSKLDSSAKKIEEVTDHLENVNIDNLIKKIEDKIDNMGTNLSNKIEETKGIMEFPYNEKKIVNNIEDLKEFKVFNSSDEYKEYLKFLNGIKEYMSLTVLYYCYKVSSIEDVNIDFKRLNEYIVNQKLTDLNEVQKEDYVKIFTSKMDGMLDVYNSQLILKTASNDLNTKKIIWIDENFITAMKDFYDEVTKNDLGFNGPSKDINKFL